MDVDFNREKAPVFQQAWTYLDRYFFDAKYHGADWAGVRKSYGARIESARTPDEMRRIMTLMIGELNASHLGFSAPPGNGAAPVTGRLGLRFDPAEYARSQRLKIAEIISLGPVAVAGGAAVGDYLLRSMARASPRTRILMRCCSSRSASAWNWASASAPTAPALDRRRAARESHNRESLLYRSWVEQTRAMVARLSNGRLGYVHMPDMSAHPSNSSSSISTPTTMAETAW